MKKLLAGVGATALAIGLSVVFPTVATSQPNPKNCTVVAADSDTCKFTVTADPARAYGYISEAGPLSSFTIVADAAEGCTIKRSPDSALTPLRASSESFTDGGRKFSAVGPGIGGLLFDANCTYTLTINGPGAVEAGQTDS